MSDKTQKKFVPDERSDEDMLLDDEVSPTPIGDVETPSQPSLSDIMKAFQSLSKKVEFLYTRDSPNLSTKMTAPQSPSEPQEKRRKISTASGGDGNSENCDEDAESFEKDLLGDLTETRQEDDIFSEMASSFDDKEESGPPVSEKLANLLNSRFGSKLPNKKLREKLNKYPIPENCANLGVPRTNDAVFRALKPYTRQADTRLRNTQSTLSKAAVAVTQCTDRLLALRDTLTSSGQEGGGQAKVSTTLAECVGNLADVLALVGHASRDISQKRRDLHRPCLPRTHAGICAPHVPMTAEWLYPHGTDFHKSLQEARETQKLGQDMRGHYTWGQSQGSQPGRNGATEDPFLGRKGWRSSRGGKAQPKRGNFTRKF